MPATLAEYGLDKLDRDERIALAEALWKSVDEAHAGSDELTDEWKQELDRRVREMEAHPERSMTWEALRDRAEARWANR